VPSVVTPRDEQLGLMAVAAAITAWGLTGVITKSIEMDAIAIAFWRFVIYAVLLTAWGATRGVRLTSRVLRAALPGGLLLSLDVMLFFSAVVKTNIASATTIGALQPVVIGVFAARFLGERIVRREILAAALAIGGVVAVVAGSEGTPQWSGAGDLFAVGALLSWSAYFVIAKRTAGTLTPLEFTMGTAWWVSAAALPAGLVFGQDMSFPPRSEWALLLLLVLFGGVVGHSAMNWGIPRLPLWLSSTMTLLIPVLASLAAWVFIDEALNAIQLAAMAVVIGSLAIIVRAQTRPVPVLPPQAGVELDEI
jgi:drug/metabolite transporter (DMT)-like permease